MRPAEGQGAAIAAAGALTVFTMVYEFVPLLAAAAGALLVLRPQSAVAAVREGVAEPDPAAGPAGGAPAAAQSPLSVDAQQLLDTSPDACVVISQEATVVWFNRAAREQMGAVRIGSPMAFARRVPELVRAIDKVRATGRPERARWSEKVPTRRWYEATVSPLTLSPPFAEPFPAMVVYIHDLSDQQRLERMREDFVANASHELRTPLASLTGMIETLQGPAREDAKTRDQFLGLMREQADRMKRLTDSLLSLSRIELRAHVHPTDVVDCAETVRSAVEMSRNVADEADVRLELALADETLPVHGDPDELLQVMNNLIENAVKYGGDGGRILVSARRDETMSGPVVALAVQDFGKGIPPEHVPRLTERFYRVDIEESRARRGTGLGLAIVKHIVNRHRGRLTVRSTIGTGSTFTVRLPLVTEEA
ncbi:ATP-binding protein [Acuticoccus yangtzensis]|uniref:ATP-binding protein n=2 Tax=Acuticoccus yangtzensis TaxID=1443441 RepID=UPI0009F8E696|nr:ATP-binding protein [Acuticoccus yangtzensis]